MKTESTSGKSQTGRITLRVLLILLISLFFGSAVYSINARRVVGNAMPMPFGVGLSVVLSGSMEPALSVNDLVVIRAADSYEVDDIIVYQSGSDLIIHRIVDVQGNVFVTKGDANNTTDDPIDLSAIKGKEVFSVPGAGFVVRLLQTTVGKMIVIALAVFLLNRSWRKERTEGDEELDQIKEEIRRLKALQEAELSKGEVVSDSKPDHKPSSENPE